jgi:hypothetical protein
VGEAFESIAVPGAAELFRRYLALVGGGGKLARTIPARMRQLSRAYRTHGEALLCKHFDALEPVIQARLLAYAKANGLLERRNRKKKATTRPRASD